MISNKEQYRITCLQLERFKRAIDEYDIKVAIKQMKSRILAKAEIDALCSEYENLFEQACEYRINLNENNCE